MILVLSTMHISKMVLKRKKSYKPNGFEREGGGKIGVPIHMFLYEQIRLEHDEVTLGHK